MANLSRKSLILSSSGLKNIVLINNTQSSYLTINDDFRFIFGRKEIKMNRIFADFISPRASFIHYSDATIDYLDLSDMVTFLNLLDKQFSQKELFTDEISTLFLQLSSGHEIEINQEASQALKLISILIGNEELYQKASNLFTDIPEDEDIDHLIKYLLVLKDFDSLFYDDQIISNLSKNFYSIEKEKLLKLPKDVLYSIISNKNLKLTNEDSLIDFISLIFENDDDTDDSINSISFLEQVDFTSLSKEKFVEVIELIEPNGITKTLWEKFFLCFNFNSIENSPERPNKERYFSPENMKKLKIIQIPYDYELSHQFEGIISYIKKLDDENFDHEVEITASSYRTGRSNPNNVTNISDQDVYFGSKNQENSWICLNFKNRKVRPNLYSIKSWSGPRGSHHLKNWKVQVSKDGINWENMDSRQNDTSLDGPGNTNTFDMRNLNNSREFYQYIKLIQTGPNSGNTFYLNIKCLEFFGDIVEQ